MRHRHAIADDDWDRIKDLLPGRAGTPGVTAKDNRLFIDAVLWIAKTGAPWRDLPERFGNWNSVWKRFDRWAKKGAWQKVFEALQDPDLEWLILDCAGISDIDYSAAQSLAALLDWLDARGTVLVLARPEPDILTGLEGYGLRNRFPDAAVFDDLDAAVRAFPAASRKP